MTLLFKLFMVLLGIFGIWYGVQTIKREQGTLPQSSDDNTPEIEVTGFPAILVGIAYMAGGFLLILFALFKYSG